MKLSDIILIEKKKNKKDKSADKYMKYIAGNMIINQTCSGKLSGERIKESINPLSKWNKLLFEADRPKPTKTNQRDANLDDLLNDRPFNAPSNRSGTRNVQKQQAGRDRTRQDVSGVRMDQRSSDFLNQIDQSGLEDDRPARTRNTMGRPEPRPPGTEVAIRGQDLANRNTQLSTDLTEPNWHKIEDLPGYMKSGIRAIGRAIFGPLTNTDIEDIDVIANVNGSGPNSDEEIRQVGAYLRRHGTRQSETEMDFNRTVLQGYRADCQIWVVDDTEFMTVKDHAGHYIYSWPTSDSKNFNLFGDAHHGIENTRNRLR